MGIIDIVIIVVLALLVLIGVFKGLFKQLLGTFALFIAIILAFLVCKPVSAALDKSSLGENLSEKITGWVSEKSDLFTESIQNTDESVINEALSEVGIPKFLHKIIINEAVEKIDDMNLGEYVGLRLAHFAIVCISFIVLFIVIFILLKVLSHILSKIIHGTLLAPVDRVLGGVVGFIKAAMIVSIVMIFLSFLASLVPSINDFVIEDMKINAEGFGIAKFFYTNNPLLTLISKYVFK